MTHITQQDHNTSHITQLRSGWWGAGKAGPASCLANRVSQVNQQNNFLLDKTRNVLIAEWDDTEQEESVDISMKCEAAQSVRPQI